jgi:hypothetical protein
MESGMAHPLPPLGPAGRDIHIRRSKDRPDGVMTAIRHHGWWYAVDDADAASKQMFRLLEVLMSARLTGPWNMGGPRPS